MSKEKSSVVFSIDQLSVSYEKHPVLWDITLQVPSGNLVGIVGPNGAGKTTLIKTALDLVKPVSGTINFFDHRLKDVRKKVSYVPQRESVDWDFPITVLELVVMGRYGKLGLMRRPKKADYIKAERYLEMVGMSSYFNRQISQLSGGQQQRVFLARALVQEADLYMMDEPFSGIDLATEKVIMDILRELRDQGKTVFVVHHDLNTVEKYFDWLIMLNMRLVASGPTQSVFTPENLNKTYGKSYALLDEALKLSSKQRIGM